MHARIAEDDHLMVEIRCLGAVTGPSQRQLLITMSGIAVVAASVTRMIHLDPAETVSGAGKDGAAGGGDAAHRVTGRGRGIAGQTPAIGEQGPRHHRAKPGLGNSSLLFTYDKIQGGELLAHPCDLLL
ncbi:hypothetical protein [Actinomadura violacea]|uniref:Uncharacterized protein n=1 Tax=Actinomadura violacea TaxID=2819934 RepID=A0ABS3RXH7_9ACTN|nr:hypothetical protein [Actinomadura violacea]MBO2461465.1 hypothetical protein [Actinomadura violacea]